MLNRNAQPTSRRWQYAMRAAEHRLSAASGAFLATTLILLTLVAPNGVAAADGGGGAWPWPLLGDVITPYKNGSDRYAAGQHRGIDIAAPAGGPVRAIVDGRVSYAGTLPDGGVTVTLRTADGEYLISHLHLASRSVARGDSIVAGQVLGAVGTSGRRSAEQPHLHLGMRRTSDQAYVDPLTLLGRPRLAAVKRVHAQRVHVAPLEAGSNARSSVHAHAAGDSSPADGYGANSQPSSADSSAGARAREGHAARHISRVAPPPLKQPLSTSPEIPAAIPAVPAQAAPVHSAEQTGSGRPNRLLLIAVAAVCLIALAMRRGPRPATRPVDPVAPADSVADERPPAEVIQLHRAS